MIVYWNHKKETTCLTCTYWIKAVHDNDLNTFYGSCHRNPPELFDFKSYEYLTSDAKSNKERIGKFPITHYGDWCGEYRYNEFLNEDFLLKNLNFSRNKAIISAELGYDINIDRIDEVLQDLENRQIRTIGEWLSIRKYEPLLIPDLGRSMMNAIDAAIELYQNNRLEEISI